MELVLTTRYGRPVDSGCVITLLGHRFFFRSSVLAALEPVTSAAEPMTYSGRPRFCCPVSIFFLRSDPASAHYSTTPNSSRYSLTFVGSFYAICCSTKQFIPARKRSLDSFQPFSVKERDSMFELSHLSIHSLSVALSSEHSTVSEPQST